jgi:plastocyanin
MNLKPNRWLGAALFGAVIVSSAFAGPVSISVSSSSAVSVQDTVVVLDPLDVAAAPVHETAVIDQTNKQFLPRVSVIRTGTSVTFPNSDRVRHQVYSFSPPKVFTLKLYAGSPPTPVVFDKPGLVVLGCNIHDQMVAFVAVVESPYFVKMPATGSGELMLPPGRYRLRVWHPNLAAPIPAQEVAVTAAPLAIPLALDLTETPASVAPWPE